MSCYIHVLQPCVPKKYNITIYPYLAPNKKTNQRKIRNFAKCRAPGAKAASSKAAFSALRVRAAPAFRPAAT